MLRRVCPQLVAPLVVDWKKVVASSTSTGWEISGSTKAFLPASADFDGPCSASCLTNCSGMTNSFCLLQFLSSSGFAC
jgi:hypothetical protein